MADFDAPSTRLNKSRAANTILLPEASIANGEENGLEGIEYLEEPETVMQTHPMDGGEFNALDADATEEIVEPRRTRRGASRSTPANLDANEVEETPEDEGRSSATRTPTQVPKKRRDAATLAASALEEIDNDDEEDIPISKRQAASKAAKASSKSKGAADKSPNPESEELPTSSARAASSKENAVEENQCRVCTSKDDLVSLFKKVETHTVADMLMIICPTVTIARKDFMPQYICNTCLDNVTIAVQLKNQCENTEKELRKKLSRSKNKLRRPTGYVVIDAPIESDPPSEDEPLDDVEFKVSDVEASASADEDSDTDFVVGRKKRASRAAAGGRGSRRKSGATPTQSKAPKQKKKRKSTSSDANENPIGGDSTDAEEVTEVTTPSPPKKKKRKSEKQSPEDKPTEYPCDECEQKFTRKLSLVLHKKAHSGGREPINCEVCGKQFKIQGAYRSHLEKHKEDYASPHNCNKCDKSFMSKSDLRKHIADTHEDVSVFFTCDKCKRAFTSEQRLTRHKDNRCPGYEVKQKPKSNELENFAVGKDLFKTVAPLTTTYWSDSFSD